MSCRNVFFSFKYNEDNWRASQVRNSQICQPKNNDLRFYDWADWEEVKKKTDSSIENWIKDQLKGTSVTVILTTSETIKSKWVKYEALESHNRGNGLIALKIHGLKNSKQELATEGGPIFGQIFKDSAGNLKYFYELYPTYDYVANDGYNNLSKWIHDAAKKSR